MAWALGPLNLCGWHRCSFRLLPSAWPSPGWSVWGGDGRYLSLCPPPPPVKQITLKQVNKGCMKLSYDLSIWNMQKYFVIFAWTCKLQSVLYVPFQLKHKNKTKTSYAWYIFQNTVILIVSITKGHKIGYLSIYVSKNKTKTRTLGNLLFRAGS